MPSTWLAAIASVVLVSLISLIGLAVIVVQPQRLQRALFVLVSLAAGSMFGDVFIHLLPEAYAQSGVPVATALTVLAGIFAFFILEKLLRWRHEHVIDAHMHIQPVGYLNLVADGIHNFIDGMLIGASYSASLPIGIATTTAVILHEIPQEIGDFGVLLQAGFSTPRALLFNLLSASLAIVGTLVIFLASANTASFAGVMLPLTAGSFIYMAGSDLLPELHKELTPAKSVIQLVAMGVGVCLMLLVATLE
jgi:zinc and cadmium transporter